MRMVSCKVLFLLACVAFLHDGVNSYGYGSDEYDDDNDDGYEEESLEDQGRKPCKRSYWQNGRFKRSTNCDDDDAPWEDGQTDKRIKKKQGQNDRNKNKIACGPDAKCSNPHCRDSHRCPDVNNVCQTPEWVCCFEECRPHSSFLAKHVYEGCQDAKEALRRTSRMRAPNRVGEVTTVTNTVFGGQPQWKLTQGNGRKCEMIHPVPAWRCTFDTATGKWVGCQPLGLSYAVASTSHQPPPGVEFNHLEQTRGAGGRGRGPA